MTTNYARRNDRGQANQPDEKPKPKLQISDRTSLLFYRSTFLLEGDAVVEMKAFLEKFCPVPTQKDGEVFYNGNEREHSHPFGATLRNFFYHLSFLKYMRSGKIFDIGVQKVRLASAIDHDGDDFAVRCGGCNPAIGPLAYIRDAEAPIVYGAGICACAAGGKEIPHCNICNPALYQHALSVDSAYYPGVIDRFTLHRSGFMVFYDFKQSAESGSTFNNEAYFYKEDNIVTFDVKGNAAPYVHGIINTSPSGNWVYKYDDVALLCQTINSIRNGDVRYIMVKVWSIPKQHWATPTEPVLKVETFETVFVQPTFAPKVEDFPVEGVLHSEPLLDLNPVVDLTSIILQEQSEPVALPEFEKYVVEDAAIPIIPVRNTVFLDTLKRNLTPFGNPQPKTFAPRPRAASFELVENPDLERQLPRMRLMLGASVLDTSIIDEHFVPREGKPGALLDFQKYEKDDPTLRMAELKFKQMLGANQIVLDFERRKQTDSGNWPELRQMLDYYFRSKHTHVFERYYKDLTTSKRLSYVTLQVNDYKWLIWKNRRAACAPTAYVKVMYNALGVKELGKSIELCIRKVQNDNANSMDSGVLIEAAIIAEFILRSERNRLEKFRAVTFK